MGLQLDKPRSCRIGALGSFNLPPGLYIYVGSAWGPGGLAARVQRHLRGSPVIRWHIDYLRQVAVPAAIWVAPHTRLECIWAQELHEHPQTSIPIPRFGASDCRCLSHLFAMENPAPDSLHLSQHPLYLPL